MKIRRGMVVARYGKVGYVGIVQGAKIDKCGQIPVYWILWCGEPINKRVWIAPYKLTTFKMPPLKTKAPA